MKEFRVMFPLLMFCGVFLTACDPDYVSRPRELVVESVTATSARLSWAGTADSYDVRVNGEIFPNIMATYFTVNGLAPDSNYSWAVRSVRNGNTSEWEVGSGFRTSVQQAPPVVSVNFANGLEKWTAGDAYAELNSGNTTFYSFTRLTFQQKQMLDDFVPAVEGRVFRKGTTVFPGDYDASEGYIFLEYFSSDYWNDRYSKGQDGVYYGDWEAVNGSVVISSYNNTLATGTITAVMVDAYSLYVLGSKVPATTTLTVAFSNVPVGNLPAAAAVREAVRSETGTFEFRRAGRFRAENVCKPKILN